MFPAINGRDELVTLTRQMRRCLAVTKLIRSYRNPSLMDTAGLVCKNQALNIRDWVMFLVVRKTVGPVTDKIGGVFRELD